MGQTVSAWNEEYSAFIGTITNSAGYTRDATEEIQPYIEQVRRGRVKKANSGGQRMQSDV